MRLLRAYLIGFVVLQAPIFLVWAWWDSMRAPTIWWIPHTNVQACHVDGSIKLIRETEGLQFRPSIGSTLRLEFERAGRLTFPAPELYLGKPTPPGVVEDSLSVPHWLLLCVYSGTAGLVYGLRQVRKKQIQGRDGLRVAIEQAQRDCRETPVDP